MLDDDALARALAAPLSLESLHALGLADAGRPGHAGADTKALRLLAGLEAGTPRGVARRSDAFRLALGIVAALHRAETDAGAARKAAP